MTCWMIAYLHLICNPNICPRSIVITCIHEIILGTRATRIAKFQAEASSAQLFGLIKQNSIKAW